VRWTVDLFRPAGLMPTAISTTLFRKGRRIGLIDAELSQNGKPIARSRAVFAHPSPTPAGEVWSPERAFPLPPPHLTPLPGEPRIYRTERQGWTPHAKDHLGGTHKQTWHFPVPLVEGEEPTRFQMTAGVADVTNLVSNWGTAGLEFINADITLAITRLPAAMELGLCPIDRTVSDGIAIGTAAVFDRQGQLGLATVVTLANAAHRVDIARSGTGRMPD
jgi:hypothetical protein